MPRVLRAHEMSKCIGCFTCMNVCASVNQKNHSLLKSAIRVKTSGGLSGRFVASVCNACKDPACAEACPTRALAPRDGGGVTLKESLCIGCKRCKSACASLAVGFDEYKNKPIICRHCGLCAQYCPHSCLIMEDVTV